jgi:hypothetical protein
MRKTQTDACVGRNGAWRRHAGIYDAATTMSMPTPGRIASV